MIYGNITLNIETGSLTILKKKAQILRHYVGTNTSDVFDVGKQETTISCVIMVKTDAERLLVEQLLHTNVERDLIFDTYYYKRVVSAETFESLPFVDGICHISAEFIALDPIPYDSTTNEVLY